MIISCWGVSRFPELALPSTKTVINLTSRTINILNVKNIKYCPALLSCILVSIAEAAVRVPVREAAVREWTSARSTKRGRSAAGRATRFSHFQTANQSNKQAGSIFSISIVLHSVLWVFRIMYMQYMHNCVCQQALLHGIDWRRDAPRKRDGGAARWI